LLAVPLATVYTRVRRARMAFARLVEEQGPRDGGTPAPALLALERHAARPGAHLRPEDLPR